MERLKSEAIENGYAPPAIRNFLENSYRSGNPWGLSPQKRADWREELPIPLFDPGKHSLLLYVGDTGSYDTRAQEATRSLAKILLKAQVPFGILGEKEKSDGNEVHRIGEKGLFEEMAKKNIEAFNALRVKKIVTLSPHAFNTFKNEYPGLGGTYEILHYTHLLRDLLKDGRLRLNGHRHGTVTFHDSCFLGRYNGEYEAPREILKSMPGLKLVEMERHRENGLCCGGGGGNFVTDLVDVTPRPNNVRLKDVLATGAGLLAVACPKCLVMFEDSVKNNGLEGKVVVKDISELVLESLSDVANRSN
jgi:Fe-S oxidoreductase